MNRTSGSGTLVPLDCRGYVFPVTSYMLRSVFPLSLTHGGPLESSMGSNGKPHYFLMYCLFVKKNSGFVSGSFIFLFFSSTRVVILGLLVD